VSRPRSDTRQRIQEVARDLFLQQGVQRTSLQDIADKSGITKPALYYHFASREDLVRSILVPMIDEGEQFVTSRESSGDTDARELLEGYFDFLYRHRRDLMLVLAELTMLVDLGLIDTVLSWRERFGKLVFGPKPTVAQAARAVIAFGGLQDCCMQFPDTPYNELRRATVDGALAALGIERAAL
jgi:AcrR family transcriptional regulator